MSFARDEPVKIIQFWTCFQAWAQGPMSSKVFRTRLTGGKFKCAPVKNRKYFTSIFRIEWTLDSQFCHFLKFDPSAKSKHQQSKPIQKKT